MADIINLRRRRKARTKAEDQQRAHDNRVRHGLPKAEKDRAARQRALDGKRLDDKTLRDDRH